MECGLVIPGKEVLPEKSLRAGSGRQQHHLRELWQIPTVAELSIAMACLKLVRYTMYLWLPVYLVQSLNYSTSDAGMYSTVFDVGGVAGSIILGIVADRLSSTESHRALLHIWLSSVAATISFILFTLTATWGVSYNTLFMMAAGAFVCGPDGLLGGSVAISVGESGGRNAGAAVTGLINGFGSFGAVIEGPLVAFVVDKFSWDAVFLLIIFLSSLGSFAIMRAFAMQRRMSRMNALLVEDSV
ncbi:glucose-6-phosphate exchanger SLC37A1-like [Ischnura elegans]|uniref:glucose-6-phosphate exchanger SLC37A1-like n=1 Tax=Ischnura elegans TaxID=197161 RepID=UPI001ED86FA1|nr:glucose-6-phosphate exchanger SLC37A1-like [Ischnura elegans]